MGIADVSRQFQTDFYNFLKPYYIDGDSKVINYISTEFPLSDIFFDVNKLSSELSNPAITIVNFRSDTVAKMKCNDPATVHPFAYELRIAASRRVFIAVSKNKVYPKVGAATLRASSQQMANDYYSLLYSLLQTQTEELADHNFYQVEMDPIPEAASNDIHYVATGRLQMEYRLVYAPN